MGPISSDFPFPDGTGGASFLPDAPVALLPVIEARSETAEAAWLKGMASAVHERLARLVPVRILPAVFLAPFLSDAMRLGSSTFLVVVPWGMPPGGQSEERLDGTALLHLLGHPCSVTQWDSVPCPRPALSELFPLNILGGWSGGGQASCGQWVSVWPGWDEQALVSEHLLLLRDLSREDAEHPLLSRSLQALFASSAEGQGKSDLQIYGIYLAHVLAGLIRDAQARLKGQHA